HRDLHSFPTRRSSDLAQIRDDFDMVDIFGVLVAQMPLDPQPQRGTVTHTQWLVVEREGQDGLGMQRVDHVDALIISIAGNAYYEDRKSTRLNSSHVKI